MEKRIYFDNSAATRLDEKVLEAMKPYFFEKYAVATSEFAYTQGIEARESLEEARATLAGMLGGRPRRIYIYLGQRRIIKYCPQRSGPGSR